MVKKREFAAAHLRKQSASAKKPKAAHHFKQHVQKSMARTPTRPIPRPMSTKSYKYKTPAIKANSVGLGFIDSEMHSDKVSQFSRSFSAA